jgi:hypothetical protein
MQAAKTANAEYLEGCTVECQAPVVAGPQVPPQMPAGQPYFPIDMRHKFPTYICRCSSLLCVSFHSRTRSPSIWLSLFFFTLRLHSSQNTRAHTPQLGQCSCCDRERQDGGRYTNTAVRLKVAWYRLALQHECCTGCQVRRMSLCDLCFLCSAFLAFSLPPPASSLLSGLP